MFPSQLNTHPKHVDPDSFTSFISSFPTAGLLQRRNCTLKRKSRIFLFNAVLPHFRRNIRATYTDVALPRHLFFAYTSQQGERKKLPRGCKKTLSNRECTMFLFQISVALKQFIFSYLVVEGNDKM